MTTIYNDEKQSEIHSCRRCDDCSIAKKYNQRNLRRSERIEWKEYFQC
jgi:hypothetical protein